MAQCNCKGQSVRRRERAAASADRRTTRRLDRPHNRRGLGSTDRVREGTAALGVAGSGRGASSGR